MNTRLMLTARHAGFGLSVSHLFKQVVDSIRVVRNGCGYVFELPMPCDIVEVPATLKKTRRTLFRRREVTDEIAVLNYYLVFDRVLTERELEMWCMFKMGYHARMGFRDE